MIFINYISNTVILFFIFLIILFGLVERKNVFNLLVEGEKVVIELFPILLGLMVTVGMLNEYGFVNFFSNLIYPILNFFKIEKVLTPLILLRPISGSTTTAVATSLMEKYGVDSKIGLITSCIMGSTETTIYVVSMYCSKIKVNNVKDVIIIGLVVDFIGVLTSCFLYNLGIVKV